jgi:hypothetical protein
MRFDCKLGSVYLVVCDIIKREFDKVVIGFVCDCMCYLLLNIYYYLFFTIYINKYTYIYYAQ